MKFWLYYLHFWRDLYKIRYSVLAQKFIELLWVARKSAWRKPYSSFGCLFLARQPPSGPGPRHSRGF